MDLVLTRGRGPKSNFNQTSYVHGSQSTADSDNAAVGAQTNRDMRLIGEEREERGGNLELGNAGERGRKDGRLAQNKAVACQR